MYLYIDLLNTRTNVLLRQMSQVRLSTKLIIFYRLTIMFIAKWATGKKSIILKFIKILYETQVKLNFSSQLNEEVGELWMRNIGVRIEIVYEWSIVLCRRSMFIQRIESSLALDFNFCGERND